MALGHTARGRAWLEALLVPGRWPALVRESVSDTLRDTVRDTVPPQAKPPAAPAASGPHAATLEDLLRRVIAGH
jgi:hypothetical protein